jgi:hypothetical protein
VSFVQEDGGVVRQLNIGQRSTQLLHLGGPRDMGYQEELRWLRSRAQACQQLDVRAAVVAAIDDELTYLQNEASKAWSTRDPQDRESRDRLRGEQ